MVKTALRMIMVVGMEVVVVMGMVHGKTNPAQQTESAWPEKSASAISAKRSSAHSIGSVTEAVHV